MNAKQAKKLRRQACVTTQFTKGMDSKEHKKEAGRQDVFLTGTVAQVKLNSASWVYYKQLKKNYTAT